MDDEMNQLIFLQIQSLQKTIDQRMHMFQQFIDNREEFGLKFTQMINQLINDLPQNLQTKELNYFKDLYTYETQQNQQPHNQLDLEHQFKQPQKINNIQQTTSEIQLQLCSEQQDNHNNINQDCYSNIQTQQMQRVLRQRPQKQSTNLQQTVKKSSYYKKKLKKLEKCQFCNKRFLHYYGLVSHEQKKHNITRHIVEEQQVKIEN